LPIFLDSTIPEVKATLQAKQQACTGDRQTCNLRTLLHLPALMSTLE
jgi:hypothetical protein